MNKKLDVHITDTVENLDLKLYEEEQNGKTIFTLDIDNVPAQQKIIIKVEEKIAALIFEGFNQLFVEDNSEYQTDNNMTNINPLAKLLYDQTKNAEDNNVEKDLQDFFNKLNDFDNKHFGYNYGDEDE